MMARRTVSKCRGVCAVLLLVASAAPNAETTVDNGASDVRPLEEVVTTATKKSRAEAAQDVPLAVTVLGGHALAERHVTDLEDLSYAPQCRPRRHWHRQGSRRRCPA